MKQIELALKQQRPDDLILKILSGKFAIVKPKLTNGTYGNARVMGINSDGIVYGYGYRLFQISREFGNTSQRVKRYNKAHRRAYFYTIKEKVVEL